MSGIQLFERTTTVIVFLVILAGVLLSHLDEKLFEEVLVVEDGPIEWLTVAGFVTAAGVCFRRAIRLRATKPRRFVLATLMLGFAFLFCAGEEISWGQRILQLESSDWFRSHNAQQEINLHNLVIGEVKINKVIFSWGVALVMIIYFIVMMPLYGKAKAFSAALDRWAVPIPRAHQAAACLIMITMVHLLVASSKKPELSEFGGAFLFLLIVLFPRNEAIFDTGVEPVPIDQDQAVLPGCSGSGG